MNRWELIEELCLVIVLVLLVIGSIAAAGGWFR